MSTGLTVPPASGIESTSPPDPWRLAPANDVMYSVLPMIAIPMMSVWGAKQLERLGVALALAASVQLHWGKP